MIAPGFKFLILQNHLSQAFCFSACKHFRNDWMNFHASKIKMKADFCTVFLVITWIVSMSAQINAEFRSCHPNTPPQFCKIYEAGRRSIQFRVCGSVLRSYFSHACGFRKRKRRNAIAETDEIVLKQQRANRFLTTHHVTKRSFNAVEECCVEGCVWEELYEYCKPTRF